MIDEDDPADESKGVGYGRPPVHTRFQPGRSGNPRGRPKGARNFSTALEKTFNKPTTYTENGRTKQVSTREAIFLKLRHKALSGDPKALALALRYDALLSERRQSAEAATSQAEDDQIIRDYLKAQEERRSSAGIKSGSGHEGSGE